MNEKWDRRFLELARVVSTWSKDPSTKCGAVIVDSHRRVIGLGYNGYPIGMRDSASDDRETKLDRTVHCEMNAILNSSSSTMGAILYTHPFLSCNRCAVHMIQAGIQRAVAYSLPPHLKDRWGESVKKTLAYYDEAKVSTCIYPRLEDEEDEEVSFGIYEGF